MKSLLKGIDDEPTILWGGKRKKEGPEKALALFVSGLMLTSSFQPPTSLFTQVNPIQCCRHGDVCEHVGLFVWF